MYYLLYGPLYLISLLPFWVLYGISNIIYGLVYYVFGYRKAVVMSNLAIAFPEKNIMERTHIAQQFYKNFIDSFIETIKIFSISKKKFDKRCNGNFEVVNAALAKGQSISLIGAHLFNWEYANLTISKNTTIAPIGIYSKIENDALNRIVLKLREKYGTIMVATQNFQKKVYHLMQQQFCMYLLADQNPSPSNCIWLNFFGRPAPFVPGPFKLAIKKNTTIIFINHQKLKRGFYYFSNELVIENCGQYTVEELLIKYRDFMEGIIRRQPDNYLWSHRRWKHNFVDHDAVLIGN